jgi:hypothetical protein
VLWMASGLPDVLRDIAEVGSVWSHVADIMRALGVL